MYVLTAHNHASSIAKVDFLKAEISAIARTRNNVALISRFTDKLFSVPAMDFHKTSRLKPMTRFR